MNLFLSYWASIYEHCLFLQEVECRVLHLLTFHIMAFSDVPGGQILKKSWKDGLFWQDADFL